MAKSTTISLSGSFPSVLPFPGSIPGPIRLPLSSDAKVNIILSILTFILGILSLILAWATWQLAGVIRRGSTTRLDRLFSEGRPSLPLRFVAFIVGTISTPLEVISNPRGQRRNKNREEPPSPSLSYPLRKDTSSDQRRLVYSDPSAIRAIRAIRRRNAGLPLEEDLVPDIREVLLKFSSTFRNKLSLSFDIYAAQIFQSHLECLVHQRARHAAILSEIPEICQQLDRFIAVSIDKLQKIGDTLDAAQVQFSKRVWFLSWYEAGLIERLIVFWKQLNLGHHQNLMGSLVDTFIFGIDSRITQFESKIKNTLLDVDTWKIPSRTRRGRFIQPLWHNFNLRVKRLSRPAPARGFKRIEWTCECGDNLYGDFHARDGMEQEMVERLEKELKLTTEMVSGRRPSSTFEKDIISFFGGSTIGVQSQPSSQPASNVQQSTVNFANINPVFNPQVLSIHTGISNSTMATQARTATGPRQGHNHRRKYLELCVNHRKHEIHHAEIDVGNVTTTDHDFFDKVKTGYFRARKKRWFFEPSGVRFVEFSVQNMGKLTGIVNGFDEQNPALPPEKLVLEENSWEYKPCPLKPRGPPVPSNIILHELMSKKSHLHTSTTWSRRMPKKLNTSIYAIPDPNEAAFGWGIHIVEGYNVFLITMLISVLALLGSLGCVIATALWWKLKDDLNAALALGAALAAILAVLLGWAISFLQGVNRA